METLNDEPQTEPDKEACVCISELQCEWLIELGRRSQQARLQWKTTLLQAEVVFLSLCVPLCLRNNPSGSSRFVIVLSALLSVLALIFGILALKLESLRAENRESHEKDRIHKKKGAGIKLYETEKNTGLAETQVFVTTALASLILLYAAMSGLVEVIEGLFRKALSLIA